MVTWGVTRVPGMETLCSPGVTEVLDVGTPCSRDAVAMWGVTAIPDAAV